MREAAIVLHASEQWVRMKCEDGSLGDSYGKGKVRKTYMLSPGKMASWNGCTVEEVWASVNALRG